MRNYMEFILSVVILTASVGLDVFIMLYGELTEVSVLSIVSTLFLMAGPVITGLYLTGKTGERLMKEDEEL